VKLLAISKGKPSVGNTTILSGISITGRPAENNVIKENKFQSAATDSAAMKSFGGIDKNRIVNESQAALANNQGYEEITRDPPPPKKAKVPSEEPAEPVGKTVP
jgi:hypothetical protein